METSHHHRHHRADTPDARPLSALDAIFTRRSVRSYTPEPIDDDTIRALLEAAVQAPTALHAEPWAFAVVQDRAALKRISDRAKGNWAGEAAKYRDLHAPGDRADAARFAERFASPDFSLFYDAGTLIVICAKRESPFTSADCWLAAENLMLAACALGLGTCCIGSALPALNTPEIKHELEIPPDLDAMVAIIVGVPQGAAAGMPRKTPRVLHWK